MAKARVEKMPPNRNDIIIAKKMLSNPQASKKATSKIQKVVVVFVAKSSIYQDEFF